MNKRNLFTILVLFMLFNTFQVSADYHANSTQKVYPTNQTQNNMQQENKARLVEPMINKNPKMENLHMIEGTISSWYMRDGIKMLKVDERFNVREPSTVVPQSPRVIEVNTKDAEVWQAGKLVSSSTLESGQKVKISYTGGVAKTIEIVAVY